ncbi:septum formation inhibitor Maf [Nakamurella antarctica]|uniref:Nucleoside triphosphate pyrophosphatase n=1 Tax=Nakamurella antarctica TaxID=1902245 RepID=A0A3G8ZY24_9ACTN|nr:nucleoside triphosphate pyrophosphatase [Nakamurella antarctica]AZI58551.1 septum formation inhibitor Maf [Nakamurella antarctica]
MTTFILASASPARQAVLTAAGIDALVHVSGIDEDALAAANPTALPADLVVILARAKAEFVAGALREQHPDAVVVGCDSMLHLDDELIGKPHDEATARRRWAQMTGRAGDLLTGHLVLRISGGVVTSTASGTCSTSVQIGDPSDEELDAYLATGEPLAVAGGFTLDGYGGWFVDGVIGDPSSVVGISLPLTRRLLREVDIRVTDLWRTRPGAEGNGHQGAVNK